MTAISRKETALSKGDRRSWRVLAVGAATLMGLAASGCGNNRADAGQNVEANKIEAQRAGVDANAPVSRSSKPPVDPTK